MEKKKLDPPEIENWIGIGDPEANTIHIWGEMNDDMYPSVVQELIECSADKRPLEIYISTPGGSIRVSLAIADIIERLKIGTTIYIVGDLASAGFILPMAGFKNPNVYRVAFPSSRALWHSGEIELGMSYHQASDWMEFQQREWIWIKKYICEHSRITDEHLNEMFRHEYFMLPEEMLELGIIDEIL